MTPAAAASLLLVAALSTASPGGGSRGTSRDGTLSDGFRLPLSGAHHRFYGPVRSRGTHFATLEVAALLARAARTVSTALPGGSPLVIGDISSEQGGPLRRHASHTSGRDVDLLFYVTDAAGAAAPADRFRRFDGDGRCADPGCDLRLDVPRTWWLVRTLLASQEPAVQYLFVAEPLRQRLLAWARAHGEHPQLLRRARAALRQPTDAAPHDDHLHLRTYCAPGDRRAATDGGAACLDAGPRWPWVRADGTAEALSAPGAREPSPRR